ncbi:MAG: hypothetical protein N3E41_08830 [Thermofilaceae archaeon]|nr:hypothetical protein [Thermofilaceae archaeon]
MLYYVKTYIELDRNNMLLSILSQLLSIVPIGPAKNGEKSLSILSQLLYERLTPPFKPEEGAFNSFPVAVNYSIPSGYLTVLDLSILSQLL